MAAGSRAAGVAIGLAGLACVIYGVNEPGLAGLCGIILGVAAWPSLAILLRREALLVTRIDGLEQAAGAGDSTQALLDNLVHGVVTTDPAGEIQWANPSALAMFGYALHDLRGRTCSVLVDGGEQAKSPLAALCATDDLRGRRADATTFPLDVAVGTLQVRGKPLILLVLTDATARREAEAQRLQAQKLESVGSLVAGIAHEIGTPLQYVQNQIDFLVHGLEVALDQGPALSRESQASEFMFLRERMPEAVRHVREGLAQVVRIVGGLRNYAHPGQARRSAVNLNRVVMDAIEITRNAWKDVATVVTELETDLPELSGHAGELMQVVVNLLVNAADAIPSGSPRSGLITVSTQGHQDHLQLTVQDNGCGMTAEVRGRAFDPFFTTKGVSKGTGQGLAIVHAVVRRHGGTIRIESSPGTGALFRIQLPSRFDNRGVEAEEMENAASVVCR